MNASAVIGYEVFRDLLSLLLGIIGVIVAALLAIIYHVLSESFEKKVTLATESLEKKVTLAAKTEMNKNITLSLLSNGNNYWDEYYLTKDDTKADTKDDWKLNQAIKITDRALRHYAMELDEEEGNRVWLICKLKNNLAYFYAEKQRLGKATPTDKTLAQQFAEYIYERIDKYPKDNREREGWIDTHNFVQHQFSLNE